MIRGLIGTIMQKTMGIAIGFEPAFIREMVLTHSPGELTKWMRKSGEIMEAVEAHFGPVQGQLLLSFAAVWQGCDFCSRGHLYASNMLRFEADGSLYPLLRNDIRELQALPDDELWASLATTLADYPEDLDLLRRQNELRLGAEPTSADDQYMLATLAVWEWITDCSIPAGAPEDVPPLQSRMSRDRSLQKRYREASNT